MLWSYHYQTNYLHASNIKSCFELVNNGFIIKINGVKILFIIINNYCNYLCRCNNLERIFLSFSCIWTPFCLEGLKKYIGHCKSKITSVSSYFSHQLPTSHGMLLAIILLRSVLTPDRWFKSTILHTYCYQF